MPPTNTPTDDLRTRLAALPLAERERIELAVGNGLLAALKELRDELVAEQAAQEHTGSEEAAGVAA